MADRAIVIAIPAYMGHVFIPTLQTVFEAQQQAQENGWRLALVNRISDANICASRNALLGVFLNSIASDILFLDYDVACPYGAFTQIMNHDKDFVAGVYRKRTDEAIEYPVRWPDQREMTVDPVTNIPLLKAKSVPAGFLRISRKALQTMCDSLAPNEWVWDDALKMRIPWLFEWGFDGQNRIGEDVNFCYKWASLGGEIWVDPTIELDHVGLKKFKGDLLYHLQQETLKAEPCLAQAG